MGIFKKIVKKAVQSRDSEIKIKYPKALTISTLPLMAGSGNYPKGKPEGIIVHFTAGHSEQKGYDAINFALQQGHRYVFIDQEGKVFQQCCFSRFGSHAGESVCPKTRRTTVSKYYFGIEVACEGALTKENMTSWGKRIPLERIRGGVISGKYQKTAGVFETFEPAQEQSLIELCVWACKEFGFDETTIFGHDEVAPNRKNDPGLSLSMSMDDFRKLIKEKLAESTTIAA